MMHNPVGQRLWPEGTRRASRRLEQGAHTSRLRQKLQTCGAGADEAAYWCPGIQNAPVPIACSCDEPQSIDLGQPRGAVLG